MKRKQCKVIAYIIQLKSFAAWRKINLSFLFFLFRFVCEWNSKCHSFLSNNKINKSFADKNERILKLDSLKWRSYCHIFYGEMFKKHFENIKCSLYLVKKWGDVIHTIIYNHPARLTVAVICNFMSWKCSPSILTLCHGTTWFITHNCWMVTVPSQLQLFFLSLIL